MHRLFRERLRDTEESLLKLRKENIGLMDTIGDLEAQVAIQAHYHQGGGGGGGGILV